MEKTQQIILKVYQETNLLIWIEAFLIDRKAQNLTKGSIEYYQEKLGIFIKYCDAQVVSDLREITPNFLRQFLIHLEEQGHNPGGVHGVYRSVKAFLRWYENEAEPDNWHNPIKKVKAPKVPLEPLEPASLQDISKLIDTCNKGTFADIRDKAILLSLLDTGARAQEFLNINLADINLITGEILIRQGKGRKPRYVYIGSKSRKAIRNYIKHRIDNNHPALWIVNNSGRLTYDGLRTIVSRRSKIAGIKPPSLHSFRRAFAINMLRAGADIYSLQELLGHKSLIVLQRYLKITTEDARLAHRLASPVDNKMQD
jgi:site-specific recombinase XerD